MRKVVVDIDDTITIVSSRKDALQPKDIHFREFHNRFNEDKPNLKTIELVRLLSKQFQIVFCTMRPDRLRERTIEWLDKHIGIEYTLLMTEESEEESITTPGNIKLFMLMSKGIKPDNVMYVIDDNERVCNRLSREGYTCLRLT